MLCVHVYGVCVCVSVRVCESMDGGRQIKRWGEGGEASCRAGWAIKTALTLEPIKTRSRCRFPAKGHLSDLGFTWVTWWLCENRL